MPRKLAASCIIGEKTAPEFVIRTIERRDVRYYVQGFDANSSRSISFELVEVQEHPDHDPNLLRRSYRFRFQVSGEGSSPGSIEGIASLRTNNGHMEDTRKIPYCVTYLEPVAFIPQQLVFPLLKGAQRNTQRINVINRGIDPIDVEIKAFNSQLLDVQLIADTDGVVQFIDVTRLPVWKGNVSEISRTKVVFIVDQSRQIEVPIDFTTYFPHFALTISRRFASTAFLF